MGIGNRYYAKIMIGEHKGQMYEPKIEILDVTPVEGRGALKAYMRIRVGCFTFNDCRLIKKQGRTPWLSMPVLSYKTQYGTVHYKQLVVIEDTKLKNELSEAVLAAWKKRGEETNDPTQFRDDRGKI
jgi:DNA-binding cell septation regulator SpoVG